MTSAFLCWLSTSRVRHFPSTPAPDTAGRSLTLDVAKNEFFSCQVARMWQRLLA